MLSGDWEKRTQEVGLGILLRDRSRVTSSKHTPIATSVRCVDHIENTEGQLLLPLLLDAVI